jgi:hypothetical protein
VFPVDLHLLTWCESLDNHRNHWILFLNFDLLVEAHVKDRLLLVALSSELLVQLIFEDSKDN